MKTGWFEKKVLILGLSISGVSAAKFLKNHGADVYITEYSEAKPEQDTLIKVIKKILPFIENLRKSLETLTEEQKQEWLGRGVEMIYENCLKSLTELNVFPIESIWLEVDSQMHEPVSMIPTDDQKMKGKIISVFEQGFYYEKEDVKIVIIPSKVVIGQ